jgi:hypothetical protein
MTNLEDLPMCLVSGNIDSRFVLRVFHLVREDEQVVFYVCEARRGRFALRGVTYRWHFALCFLAPARICIEPSEMARVVRKCWWLLCCIGLARAPLAWRGLIFFSLEQVGAASTSELSMCLHKPSPSDHHLAATTQRKQALRNRYQRNGD